MAAEVASSVSIPSTRAAGSLNTTNTPAAVAILTNNSTNRNPYLGVDAFSPVNQNGSFDFDRVLMSGQVNKRSRKTKQWKRFYLVMRPNVLSVYKNHTEAKLLKQLYLHEVTAVATLKDPKGRRNHMFGVFSPSRNFHFQASSEAEARAWVDLIKREAKVDEEESSTVFGSPAPDAPAQHSMDHYILSGDEGDFGRRMSSSPEPMDIPDSYTTTRDGVRIPTIRQSSHDQYHIDYSGAEQGSFSDFSDAGPAKVRKSAQIPRPEGSIIAKANAAGVVANSNLESEPRASMGRNVSGTSLPAVAGSVPEEEKVIYHGWLLVLKSKGGVRQWKRLWTVLRPKNLSFYKSEDEYAAQLILPISAILSAVEIDPLSKTKSNCMQIIVEERSYRFSAPNEEALTRWLGALQSQIAKRNQRRAARESEA